MNNLMRRLSRRSFGSNSKIHKEMVDTSQSSRQTILSDSLITDSETSIEESQPMPSQTHAPLPPRPPPRRRRKQTSVFYSSAIPLLISNDESRPTKRPTVPPPIPPRTVSSESASNNVINDKVFEEDICCSSSDHMFSKEELIENLTQNLSVMEELNQKLRNQLKDCRTEKSNLVNELAAIHIERNQLLQTCKEIETLKDNEWMCSICLDDRPLIVSTDRQIVSTFCGHLFCNSCVNMALAVESVCPTCRKNIVSKHKRPPYIFLYF